MIMISMHDLQGASIRWRPIHDSLTAPFTMSLSSAIAENRDM